MANSKPPRTDGNGRQPRAHSVTTKILLVLALGAFLFLVAGNVLRYMGFGPLPMRMVTQLGHMDSVGKSVQILVGRAKADNAPQSLVDVRSEYEDVQSSFNQALQRVHDGIALSALDPDDLQSTLQGVQKREIALQDRLLPLSKQIVKAGLGDTLEFLWKLAEAGVTSWGDLIKEKGERKRAAVDMLDRMRWPNWDEIPKRSLLES